MSFEPQHWWETDGEYKTRLIEEEERVRYEARKRLERNESVNDYGSSTVSKYSSNDVKPRSNGTSPGVAIISFCLAFVFSFITLLQI